ncbi:DUF11 domain-containing protein [Candidatus Parcubacteria bacterium]|nr:DUF11 domain-containing protein [Candidatus Parcubacteria bacterium]
MKILNRPYVIAGLLVLFFVVLVITVGPLVVKGAYSYGNSGTGILPAATFPGFTIGPVEQYNTSPGIVQLNAWIKNNTNSPQTIVLQKHICRCKTATGWPARGGIGQCQGYWDGASATDGGACLTVPETLTLPAQAGHLTTQTVENFSQCGSEQIDFSMNGIVWAAGFANLGADCQVAASTPNPTPTPAGNPPVTVTKSARSSTVNVGQIAEFEVRVKNESNTATATNVEVVDRLPRGQMQFVGVSGLNGCVMSQPSDRPDLDVVKCLIPSLSAGHTATLIFQYRVPSGTACNTNLRDDIWVGGGVQSVVTATASTRAVCSTPNLVAACSASSNNVQMGNNVTFNGSATGGAGTGTYSYLWSGACTGTSQNCTNSFATAGTKTATLTVTSGTQSDDVTCQTNVTQATTAPVAYCSASSNTVQVGSNVTFNGSGTGGNGTYTYSWSGACNGTSQNCTNSFSNSGVQTATLVVTSGGQASPAVTCPVTVNQQANNNLSVSCYASPSQAQVNNTVTYNANVGNANGNVSYQWSQDCTSYGSTCSNSYSFPGTKIAYLTVTTSTGQSANTSCQSNITQTINQCNPNAYQQCSGGNVHWFNSCGQDQGISQYCTSGCQNNTCITTNTNQSLQVTKAVENLSTGILNYTSIVNAKPGDILQFRITVANNQTNSQFANNVTVRDIFPTNLTYNNALTLDGIPNSGNVISGLNIGSLPYGQTKTITYQAQVGPAQNFSFGTTTLNNSVVATTDSGASGTAFASVVVTRSGVLGATTVSTGLTNNFLLDSFFLPLVAGLIGLWMWRRGMFGAVAWFDSKKMNHKDYLVKKQLQSKISMIREREVGV